MIVPLLCLVTVFLVLCLAEALWRTKQIHGEGGRKFVHIIIGSFVAFWPFLMSFRAILIISVGFFVVLIASRMLNIFNVIRAVKRKTWGDVLFAVSLGTLAIISPSKYIFTAAALHMSLADGLAALIGGRLGKGNRYKIFGYYKSLAGTLTFALVSSVVIVWFLVASPYDFNRNAWPIFVGLPLMAAVAENISVRGTDNMLVPLLVALVINSVVG